jgi:hypothetical protein
MLRAFLLISFIFLVIYLNMNIFENYDEDGYENKRFLHCSDSNKLNHRIKDTGQPVSGYGFNNNYFVEETDISYKGGDGDFSKFLDVYKIRKDPPTLQAPICMHKNRFDNSLNIPSFFRQIYQGGDSSEILNVEQSFYDLLQHPFDIYRSPIEIKNKLILDDETNNMVLRQHSEETENKPHRTHIEIEDFQKTCSKHDPLGTPFQCGSLREFNYDNALKECEDDSLSEKSCNKICCKNIQESFIMS